MTDEKNGVYSGSYHPLISGNYTVVGSIATAGGVDVSYFKGRGDTQGEGVTNPLIAPSTATWWRDHAIPSKPTVGVGVGTPMLSYTQANLTNDWYVYVGVWCGGGGFAWLQTSLSPLRSLCHSSSHSLQIFGGGYLMSWFQKCQEACRDSL